MEALYPAWQCSPFAGYTDEAEAVEKIVQEAILWKPDEAGSWRGAEPAPENVHWANVWRRVKGERRRTNVNRE